MGRFSWIFGRKTIIRLLYVALCITTMAFLYALLASLKVGRPKPKFLTGEEARQFQRAAPFVLPPLEVSKSTPETASTLNMVHPFQSLHWDQPFPHNVSVLNSDELTIVTAYFNIGEFAKGTRASVFTPALYHHWMKIFQKINNPIIAYFDNNDDAAYMRFLRSKLPEALTRIIMVDRSKLWSFSKIEPRIAKLYKRPGYPYHLPNTVVSAYSAAMHAKYELMHRTIQDNPFNTTYICWLDIGLFRQLASQTVDESFEPFRLWLPPGFEPEKIAYTEVYHANNGGDVKLTAQRLVSGNDVWVCGCFFIGRVDVMWKWTLEYMDGAQRMLDDGWMSTDQQLIYWLMHGEGYNPQYVTTKIQVYRGDGRYNEWFHLGFVSKDAGNQQKGNNGNVKSIPGTVKDLADPSTNSSSPVEAVVPVVT